MQHSAIVRVLHRVGHVADQAGGEPRGHGLLVLLEPAGKRRALAVSRSQVLDLPDLSCLIQRHEIGVIERGRRPGLPDEPLPHLGRLCRIGARQLERNLPAKFVIDRQEDDPEPPAAQLTEDPELAESPAIGPSDGRARPAGRTGNPLERTEVRFAHAVRVQPRSLTALVAVSRQALFPASSPPDQLDTLVLPVLEAALEVDTHGRPLIAGPVVREPPARGLAESWKPRQS